jgi:hypothetical protein
VARDFSELVDRGDIFLFDVELDLDVTPISASHPSALGSPDNLQGVLHVRCYQELVRNDLKQRKDFNPDHLRNDSGPCFFKMLLLRFFVELFRLVLE